MICLVYELLRTTCFPLLEACLPGIHFPFGLPCSLTQWLVRNSDSCFQRAKDFSCPNLARLITTVSVKVKGTSPLPVVRLRKDQWLILGCKTSVVWQLPLVIKKYRDFVEQCPCKCGLWRPHSVPYEEYISVLGQFSCLSRAAKLLQVIAQQASRIGRLLLVLFKSGSWAVMKSGSPVRNVNLINPFLEFWLLTLST